MARQLSFDLPVRSALGREDFFVSPSNAAAVAMIELWPNWPSGKLLLSGPVGSGKTHLAHVWSNTSGATLIDAQDLPAADIPTLARTSVAVENAERIAGDAVHEDALFHLHNLILAEGQSLLITARMPAARWGLALPDLASRMQGTTQADLTTPDDALLSAVLMKLMADRQLSPAPQLIPYLVRRIDRSFAAAQSIVARLDDEALARNVPITRALAADLLDRG
ncbi:MAG: chromosomal replication initiator DnaA [Roseovarius sp.]